MTRPLLVDCIALETQLDLVERAFKLLKTILNESEWAHCDNFLAVMDDFEGGLVSDGVVTFEKEYVEGANPIQPRKRSQDVQES